MKKYEYSNLCEISYLKKNEILEKLIELGYSENNINVFDIDNHRVILVKHGIKQFIIFRGTSNANEMLTDINCLMNKTVNGKVHKGFNTIAEKMIDVITTNIDFNCWIYITGHSLGAATAEIVANKLFEKNYLVKESIEVAKPRTGDKQYAKYSANMQFNRCRIEANMDVVCEVPLKIMGYRHHNRFYYIDRKNKVWSEPSQLYIWWDKFNTAKENKDINEFVTDHAVKKYTKALKECDI